MNQTNTEGDGDPVWGKSLAKMPMFTIRKIQKQRNVWERQCHNQNK